MINIVLYEPEAGDPRSGRIIQTMQLPAELAREQSHPFVVVPDPHMTYDQTHRVVNGALVEMEAGDAE
jgi:hypothetical protein